MTVRVIRVLECEYKDHEAAEADIARWAVAPQAIKRFGDTTIRSTVILPYDLPEDWADNA